VIDSVLVIGYGNSLRTDDGLGWHAAERLAADPRLAGTTVIARHQLTPELALDVSRAAFVVFVDASHGPAAGTFTIEWLQAPANIATGWSHILSPSSLVDLARELYGQVPDVVVIRVGVESLVFGDRLSAAAEASLPGLIDAVAELIADHSETQGTRTVAVDGHA
jgi:hydrogenase maturation protease